MVLTKEKRKSVVDAFKGHAKDTGSSVVQIALLTERINYLTGHMKKQKKDYASQRGLLKLVSRRRKLLTYLKRGDAKKYAQVIEKLNLRK